MGSLQELAHKYWLRILYTAETWKAREDLEELKEVARGICNAIHLIITV